MPESWTAATWNLRYDVPARELVAPLRKSRARGVSLYLVQEASAPGVLDVFREAGLKVYRHRPQYLLAWDPGPWMLRAAWGERLAPSPYFRKGSKKPVYCEAAMGILCDESGRTLTAMSYHTPAHVQVPDPPERRVQVLEETARGWGEVAESVLTHATLFGGDDNVDERGSFGPWDFMLRASTGLRQVRAPRATLGRHRRVDDFRVEGLRVGKGWTMATPGDHRIHGRQFGWRFT